MAFQLLTLVRKTSSVELDSVYVIQREKLWTESSLGDIFENNLILAFNLSQVGGVWERLNSPTILHS